MLPIVEKAEIGSELDLDDEVSSSTLFPNMSVFRDDKPPLTLTLALPLLLIDEETSKLGSKACTWESIPTCSAVIPISLAALAAAASSS